MRPARKYAAICLFLSSLTLVASGEAAAKKQPQPEAREYSPVPNVSMSVWQARKAVITGLQTVRPRAFTHKSFFSIAGYSVRMNPDSIQVSGTRIDCSANVADWNGKTGDENWRMESCDVDLRNIGMIGIASFADAYGLSVGGDSEMNGLLGHIAWDSVEQAQTVANALNRLRTAAHGGNLAQEQIAAADFRQKAADWRALPTKPAISEEVRRHRILAENAVKEKQFAAAIEEYEAGLAIDPFWPEGHFNSALLAAEMEFYSEAIRHMQAYLELVPDAPDSASARDQVVIWEAKIKQARVVPVYENPPDQGQWNRSSKPKGERHK